MSHEGVRSSGVRRALIALATGAAVALVVGAFGYRDFELLRTRLVTSPIAAVEASVDVPLAWAQGHSPAAPFVFTAAIRHDPGIRASFRLLLDGREVCATPASGGGSTRASCVVQPGMLAAASEHHLLVRGPASAWSLESLEAATHFGGTRGFGELYVVPHDSSAYKRPSPIVALFVGIVVALLLSLPEVRWSRLWRIAHKASVLATVALLALTAAAPFVSRYVVVWSLKTLVMLLVVALGARIAWAVRRCGRSLADIWPLLARPAISSLIVGVIVSSVYGVVVSRRIADANGNSSALLQISRSIFDHSPLVADRADLRAALVLHDSDGYDGQFMYFTALDPFLRTFRLDPDKYLRVIDAPAYRYGRIGFGLAADVLTVGQSTKLPATMVWLTVVATGLAAFALARVAQFSALTPAWGLLVLLIPAFWQSVQVVLPEPLAAALLIAGYSAVLRRRLDIAGLAFAGSLLVRETGILFVLVAAGLAWRSSGRAATTRLLLIALLPVLAWRAYVGWMLFPVFGAEAFYQNPRNVTLPFRGFLDLWGQMRQGVYADGDPGFNRAALWYPVVLILGLIVSLRLASRQRTPLAFAALAYAILAVSLDFPSIWVFTGNGQRGTYELFVMLALVTTTTFRSMRGIDRGLVRTFWLLAAAFVLFGSFDAAYVRDALFG